MRIAVDAMGGDHGCDVIVEGVKLALQGRSQLEKVILVGQQPVIEASLRRLSLRDSRVDILHTDEVLTMQDKPLAAVRRKKGCSLTRTVDLVKSGSADAAISQGNTGGLVAAATLKLGNLPGVERAGIATVIPAPENNFVLLDSGANIECKPIHLAQYAVMGSIYSREILGYPNPRVGVLSVGTEEIKGNELTLEAYRLCKMIPVNFIGNVEGHDLFQNSVDVVLCDGFVGNIVLKTCESLAKGMVKWLKSELMMNPKRQLGALLAKNAFRAIADRVDPDAYGGAPLLGLNGCVTKAHGSARGRAIMSAMKFTGEAILHNINKRITDDIAAANLIIAKERATDATTAAFA